MKSIEMAQIMWPVFGTLHCMVLQWNMALKLALDGNFNLNILIKTPVTPGFFLRNPGSCYVYPQNCKFLRIFSTNFVFLSKFLFLSDSISKIFFDKNGSLKSTILLFIFIAFFQNNLLFDVWGEGFVYFLFLLARRIKF